MKWLLKISLGLFGLLFLSLLSCKEEQKEVADKSLEKQVVEVKITQKDIENLSYEDYVLSDEVQDIVIDWNGYQQVASSVSFLKTADLTFFKSDIDVIKTTIEDLKKGIPTVLKSNSVLSRLTVVETKFLKLQNDLTLNNIPKEQQLQSLADVLTAWSYLTYYMNKKLEFVATDVSRPQ